MRWLLNLLNYPERSREPTQADLETAWHEAVKAVRDAQKRGDTRALNAARKEARKRATAALMAEVGFR